MSLNNIRNALEAAIDGMQPIVTTAHQGEAFTPTVGVPYQAIYVLPATPENPTMGDGYAREVGILQVSLMYPAGEGMADATERAEAIRALFRRGATFSFEGTDVHIDRTPAILDGDDDEGFVAVIVRTTWHADIYT